MLVAVVKLVHMLAFLMVVLKMKMVHMLAFLVVLVLESLDKVDEDRVD